MIDPQKHLEAFRRRGLSLPEFYVLSTPYQAGPLPAHEVPNITASGSEGDPRGNVSVSECEQALTSLLNRDLVRVLSKESLAELIEQHQGDAPIYGFPLEGDVDFTLQGAELFRELSDELFGSDFFTQGTFWEDGNENFYTTDEKTAVKFVADTKAAEPKSVVTIDPVAQWCIYWWNGFPSGFRVTIKRQKNKHSRMIFEIPLDVQMAIKLRAVKDNTTTGAVVAEAIRKVFASDIDEAKDALAEMNCWSGPLNK